MSDFFNRTRTPKTAQPHHRTRGCGYGLGSISQKNMKQSAISKGSPGFTALNSAIIYLVRDTYRELLEINVSKHAAKNLSPVKFFHTSSSWFLLKSRRVNTAISTKVINKILHGFSRKLNHFFSSKSSWTPKTQPNDALRRRLVEFLVFNSAFGRHRHWLIPITSYSFIISVMSFSIDSLESANFKIGSLSSESIDNEWHNGDNEWVWCDWY